MSLSMLLEIEENHKIIKEGIKTLKNGSCIYILRKLKLEFENEAELKKAK
ncbi:hypothetical protein JMF89_00360 [Clostridiaceae bacterium UIB06]|uniref:Uncharacterized protein n=1 Tax=Clostridium thailandense TaxID=2794346 RepID=A0A949WUW0_9CLOT|nr:hypothetical protein [Clostridium thailandense]MBV7273007.1 hypothetical protein [Clostridium thailandense]MCH5135671.1 hypothetical protein [Clostridiaceae bacterium UIB06]